MLNKSSIHQAMICLNRFSAKSDSLFHFSLDRNLFSLPQNTFPSLLSLPHLDYGLDLAFLLSYDLLISLFLCISCIRPRFLGFLKTFEIFVKFLGWVLLVCCYIIMHCIPFVFSQCFMHLDVCLFVEKIKIVCC